jgi:hypothetical protein
MLELWKHACVNGGSETTHVRYYLGLEDGREAEAEELHGAGVPPVLLLPVSLIRLRQLAQDLQIIVCHK